MNDLEEKHKDLLSELSSQSWNLEMLISGVALFSTSFLPSYIDDAIDYYFENYQISSDIANTILPTLAYSFSKAMAYILIATFFIHFVMRAFWVAMIGLRAVYPMGIQYDKLPNVNDQLREHYRQRLGTLDNYIIKLDKTCNQLYGIAFILVSFSIMMTFMYLTVFFLAIGIRIINKDIYDKYGKILGLVFGGIMMSLAAFTLLFTKKSMREHPYWGKIYLKIAGGSEWMYFGMYKPMNYLNFVFASNMPRKKHMTSSLVIGFAIMAFAISIYISKIGEHKGVSLFETRDYYTTTTLEQINPNQYDNIRLPEDRVAGTAIQSDIITEPFVKLFIAYPKMMDEDISKFCKLPQPPDSLTNSEKRSIKNKARLACMQQYFQVAINDSIYRTAEFLYTQHGDRKTKGVTAYLPTNICKVGQNTLFVKVLDTDSLPKKIYREYDKILFWYTPDN